MPLDLAQAIVTRDEPSPSTTSVSGVPSKSEPRRQVDTQALLEHASRDVDYEPEELLRPVPRGRLREAERVRREALAEAVFRARAGGETLEAIGTVIGIPKQRVFDLAECGVRLRIGRQVSG